MSIITSVAINACILPFAMIRPEKAPNKAPSASDIPIATKGEKSEPTKEAAIAPAKAKVEPTVRSIPDVKITKVMPTAMIALMDVCCKILKKLFKVKKLSLKHETIAIKTSNVNNDFCSIRKFFNVLFCNIDFLLCFANGCCHKFFLCCVTN